jgi:hypothetical protein
LWNSGLSFLSAQLGNAPARPLSVDDEEMNVMLKYILRLQKELAHVIQQVETVLPAQQKLAAAYGALSVAADSLAQAEGRSESIHGLSAISADSAANGSVEYIPPVAASAAAASSAPVSTASSLVGDAELARILHLLAQSSDRVRSLTTQKTSDEDVELLQSLKDIHRTAQAVEVNIHNIMDTLYVP